MSATYLDRITGIETSVAIKAPVKVATTTNIALSGEQTIDGIAVVTGDRVLVRAQSSAIDNGIWVVSTGSWSRADDFNGARDVVRGTEIFVNQGSTYSAARFAVVTDAPAIGISDLTFSFLGSALVVNFAATRNAQDAAAMTAALTDAQVGFMAGLAYMKDSTATGAASATNDLGVDGLVPYGVARPEHYGATGDGVTDDTAAIAAMMAFGGGDIAGTHLVDGQIDTVTGLDLAFRNGSLLKQRQPSTTGAFLTNVTVDTADRAQTDIRIVNAQIDGTDYLDPVDFAIAGGTTTTITLPAGASATDDFYNGLFVQFLSGANANGVGYRTITDYNGTSKVATLSAAITAPAAGDHVLIGYNDNAMGFAWGAERVAILGGHVRNFPATKMVPPGAGGKGVNFEQGVIDGVIDGLSVENLGVGFYISGTSGTHSTGASKETTGIRAANLRARNCGAALAIANIDLADGISGDGDEQEVTISGLTYRDCGHAPWRIVGTAQEKSGAVALMGANGVTLTNVRGYNSPSYPASYPADYAARCGYGLSGPIGAALWGHGRNVTIRDFHHFGDADAAVHIGRCRALGDDAPSTGQVTQALGWTIQNLNVHGTVDRVVSRDEALGFDETQVSGYWQIVVDTVTTGFVPTTFESAQFLTLDITERATGKRVIGTPKDILIRGNTFADYPAGLTDLRLMDHRKFTIADDAAVSFTPLLAHGILEIASGSSLMSNLVRYRATATPQTAVFLTTTNFAVTTGALTGTTGTDTNLTVSAHTDGKLYIENRRGATVDIDVWLKR